MNPAGQNRTYLYGAGDPASLTIIRVKKEAA